MKTAALLLLVIRAVAPFAPVRPFCVAPPSRPFLSSYNNHKRRSCPYSRVVTEVKSSPTTLGEEKAEDFGTKRDASDLMKMDYYELLGFPASSAPPPSDLKKSFLGLAKVHHPDAGGEEEVFKRLLDAYETLSDEESRREYDRSGKGASQGSGGDGGSAGRAVWDDYVRQRKEQKVSRRRSAVLNDAKALPLNRNLPPHLRDDGKLPRVGDVVTFEHGAGERIVGLLVSRNIDRGDVQSLIDTSVEAGKDPNELLELCEVSTLEATEHDCGQDSLQFRYDINSVRVLFPRITNLKGLSVTEKHVGLETWNVRDVQLESGETLGDIFASFDYDSLIV